MFKRLFGLEGSASGAIRDALYAQIVAAARQPFLYSRWGVPDTPLGRYEMMALHMVLFLERTSKAGPELRDVAQEVTDEFFRDVEHSIRELGIGDMGVPKRMKTLARMFYGRARSYSEALAADDRAALATALGRNIVPDRGDWAGAGPLAAYALERHAELARQPADALLAGRMALGAADEAQAAGAA